MYAVNIPSPTSNKRHTLPSASLKRYAASTTAQLHRHRGYLMTATEDQFLHDISSMIQQLLIILTSIPIPSSRSWHTALRNSQDAQGNGHRWFGRDDGILSIDCCGSSGFQHQSTRNRRWENNTGRVDSITAT
jgi:hypothetical protein